MNLKHISILFLSTVLYQLQAYGQSKPGFVQQENMKVSGITTDAQIYPLSDMQKQTTRAYYDGLGRTLQTVGVQASPLQNDLIQPVVYDNLGRQTTGYLPYAGLSTDTMGSYRSNAISTAQPAFYNQTGQHIIPMDANPYAQQVFENSPLQRLLTAGMVGNGFQPGVSGSHVKSVIYRFNNTAADGNILDWNPDGSYTSGTYFAANTLSVTDGKDEDNIEALSFTDISGHLVLKRQLLSSGNLDTYYVYNNAGLISFVVPPKALALMVTSGNYSLGQTGAVSTLLFSFTYNVYGQLTEKIVPGKGPMYIVYDVLHRPVLMQDANMAVNHQWNYIKYDSKGRAISQGIYTDNNHTSYSAMQTYVYGLSLSPWYESRNGTAINGGYYTNNIFPTGIPSGTSLTPLAYAYFDNYDINNDGTADYTYQVKHLTNEETPTGAAVKGMPTIVCQSTVGAITSEWLTKVSFYDKRLHPIQVISNNQVYYTGYTASANLTDSKTSVPDFTGMPQQTQVVKKAAASGATTTVLTTLAYDHMYRILSISQAYNGGASSVVSAYSYSEAGQVIQKNLGQIAAGTIPATLNLSGTVSGTSTAIATTSVTLSPGFSTASGATFSAFISTGYLQTVDMRYNIRGQLLSLNNSKLSNDGGVTNNDNTDLFGMLFSYDQVDANLNNDTGNTPSFDGRLTAVKWMSKDGSGNSSYERSFVYHYDGVNRYTGETYAERTQASTGYFSNNVHGFDESGITYDAGGNIQTLNRNSSTQGTNSNVQIDALNYTYSTTNPNQLLSVTDGTGANYTGAGFRNLTGSTGSYTYDANGNLTADPYKGLTFDNYNVLNKTDKITLSTGNYINYTYDSGGSLIRKQQYSGGTLTTTTDYVDGFVYINSVLSYFPMPEGRVINNSGTLVQEFIITDPQGNARLSFQNNGSGTAVVKQENSYYGFGLIMPNSPVGTPPTPNKQLYNGGSEWQNDFGNLPDYYQAFYRNYDAALGRFVGVDPVAESAESMTGYQYAGNNPIAFNDPDGALARPAPYVTPNQQTIVLNNAVEDALNNDMDDFLGDDGGDGFGGGGGGGGGGYGGFGGNWQNEGAFDDGGPFSAGTSGGGSSAASSGGLTDAQWLFVQVMATGGPITENYKIGSDGVFQPISDWSAFSLAIAYTNQFDTWGTHGIADNVSSAVLTYDRDPNRKGPGFTLAGTLLNIPDDTSDDSDPTIGTMLNISVVIKDNPDDRNWFDGVVEFLDPLEKGITLATTPGLLDKSYRLASESSAALDVLGKATGFVTLLNSGRKTIQAWQHGDKAGVIENGLLTIGQGVAMGVGEEFELGWNAGTFIYDYLEK